MPGARSATETRAVSTRRLLAGPLRGHEPPVQGVRRSGRLSRGRFWKEPFVRDGAALSLGRGDGAPARRHRPAGALGAGSWGAIPRASGDYPVAGVSWYEAAAYAEFAGKSLPTFFHWYRAGASSGSCRRSSSSATSARRASSVGQHRAWAPSGPTTRPATSASGCWTSTGGHRYTLGGAWNDPSYLYQGSEVTPLGRSPTLGFAAPATRRPPPPDTLAPVEVAASTRDYSREKPVGTRSSRHRSLYPYDGRLSTHGWRPRTTLSPTGARRRSPSRRRTASSA